MNKIKKNFYLSFNLGPTTVDYIFKKILDNRKNQFKIVTELGKYSLINKIVLINQFDTEITYLLKYLPYGHFEGCDLYIEVSYETMFEFTEEILMNSFTSYLFNELKNEVEKSVFNKR
jgi:hypothetical protein